MASNINADGPHHLSLTAYEEMYDYLKELFKLPGNFKESSELYYNYIVTCMGVPSSQHDIKLTGQPQELMWYLTEAQHETFRRARERALEARQVLEAARDIYEVVALMNGELIRSIDGFIAGALNYQDKRARHSLYSRVCNLQKNADAKLLHTIRFMTDMSRNKFLSSQLQKAGSVRA